MVWSDSPLFLSYSWSATCYRSCFFNHSTFVKFGLIKALPPIWVHLCCNSVSGNSVKELAWGALDDVVMGGVSESSFQVDPTGGENGGPTGLFKGCFLSSPCTFMYLSFVFY